MQGPPHPGGVTNLPPQSKGLQTAKLILGIISLVLFILITFQSCVAGVVNVMTDNTDDMSGSAGLFLSFCMLIAGIVGIVTRKNKVGGIVAGMFFGFGSGMGFIFCGGIYTDLIIWSVLAFLFGAVFFIGSLLMDRPDRGIAPSTIVLCVISLVYFLLIVLPVRSLYREETLNRQFTGNSLPVQSIGSYGNLFVDEDLQIAFFSYEKQLIR